MSGKKKTIREKWVAAVPVQNLLRLLVEEVVVVIDLQDLIVSRIDRVRVSGNIAIITDTLSGGVEQMVVTMDLLKCRSPLVNKIKKSV